MNRYQILGIGILFLIVLAGGSLCFFLNKDDPQPIDLSADRIAFQASSSRYVFDQFLGFFNNSIYVMNVDKPGLIRVTKQPNIEADLTWSPDGGSIAYFDFNSRSLYSIQTDGSGQPELLKQEIDIVDLAWSPDGTEIVYSNGVGRLYLLNLINLEETQLLNAATRGIDPTWSPSGDWIAFALIPQDDVQSSIAIIHKDGSNLKQLTPNDNSRRPDWSPDGSQIAFERNRNIYVMNEDGTQVITLTKDSTSSWPSWSSDGTRISFLSSASDTECYRSLLDSPTVCANQLRIMDADGSNVVDIGQGRKWLIKSPEWAPRN